jgi:drug/metabolite transporter (DMT)-like permease
VIGIWLVVIPANVVPCSIGYSGGVLLLGIGITAAVAQLMMTHAYRVVSVSTGSLLGMLLPVINLLIGFLVFHESLSLRGLTGSMIVLTACLVVILDEQHKEKSCHKDTKSQRIQ